MMERKHMNFKIKFKLKILNLNTTIKHKQRYLNTYIKVTYVSFKRIHIKKTSNIFTVKMFKCTQFSGGFTYMHSRLLSRKYYICSSNIVHNSFVVSSSSSINRNGSCNIYVVKIHCIKVEIHS